MKVYVNDGEGIMAQVRSVRDEAGVEHNKQRLYYHYDSLGSVSAITNEIGKPLQEYYYTPYGEAYNVEEDAINGLRFIGRYGGYTDDDAGLTYFWHRWYDSDDGRWISRDPIGRIMLRLFHGNQNVCHAKGGVYDNERNRYNYANNSPVIFVDENGLNPVAAFMKKLVKPILKSYCISLNQDYQACKKEYESVMHHSHEEELNCVVGPKCDVLKNFHKRYKWDIKLCDFIGVKIR